MSYEEREYIRRRKMEIAANDAFAIPVTAYRGLHHRCCLIQTGSPTCTCGMQSVQKRLDEKIERQEKRSWRSIKDWFRAWWRNNIVDDYDNLWSNEGL